MTKIVLPPKDLTKPKKGTKKLKSLPTLRRKADTLHSKSVRLRDSEWVEDGFYGTCITCSKTGQVAWFDGEKIRFNQGWDNGHFIGRGTKITRYDERNCNLQCSFRCNKMNSGEYQKYKAALKLKYGDEVPGELEQLAQDNPNYSLKRAELNEVINDSQEILDWHLSKLKK